MSASQAKTASGFIFRFDATEHEYIDVGSGAVYPHITGMLKDAGLVDDRWYTDASRERGSFVHRLTAQYDLGAIERDDLLVIESPWKGWLVSHVDAMHKIGPRWTAVEEPLVHSRFRYGGRPDRVGTVYAAVANTEIKTGDFEDAHPIQTALQNILIEEATGIPAEAIPRYGLYLKTTGRWVFHTFSNTRRDFQKARDIIRRWA